MNYRANLDGFRGLIDFMLRDCCGGRPEICAAVVDEFNAANPDMKVELKVAKVREAMKQFKGDADADEGDWNDGDELWVRAATSERRPTQQHERYMEEQVWQCRPSEPLVFGFKEDIFMFPETLHDTVVPTETLAQEHIY